MKKLFLFAVAVLFSLGMNAQFKVLLFYDNDYKYFYEYDSLANSLKDLGVEFDTLSLHNGDAVPTYDVMKDYNFIIWYGGPDGVNLDFWDVSDTAGVGYHGVKLYKDLVQVMDSGDAVVWIDAIDGFYDICGSAPDAFEPGDFIYDYMGISKYASQSKADDGGTGLANAVKSSTNNIDTVAQFHWAWSTVWYADGFELTDKATPLYEMGGDDTYPLKGQPMIFYKNMLIYSGARIGKITPREKLTDILGGIIDAIQNGGVFTPVQYSTTNVSEVSNGKLTVYPNPATDNIRINESGMAQISDLSGRIVKNVKVSKGSSIDISNLSNGIYNITVKTETGVFTQKFIKK